MTATIAGRPFYPIDSTAPCVTFGVAVSGSTLQVLEVATRSWEGPSNRAVRILSLTDFSVYVKLGTSTVVANSSDSMLLPPRSLNKFYVSSGQTYISAYSTAATNIQVCLGYAGGSPV